MDPTTPAPLFASHELLYLTLVGDLERVKRERGEDAQEYAAALTYQTSDGTPVVLNLAMRTRGKFRLHKRTCNFPPLRLNFDQATTANTIFANQHKLKLVTHCQDKRDRYEQSVLQEYLLYRIYNLLTNASFRVRLARITYSDTGGKPDTLTKYTFLIENEDQMAARNRASILDLDGIHQYEIVPEQMTLLSVYQYFIANTDWSVSSLHNIKILLDAQNRFVAVPFDFDWSGVIDARYAKPDPALGTYSVRNRVLISECHTQEEFAPVFTQFQERKDEIYSLVRNQAGLEEQYRSRTLEYFDKFYETLNDPKKVRREFVRRCPEG